MTLNYDDSVEEAARLLGGRATPHTWWSPPPIEREVLVDATRPLNVLHWHGYYEPAHTIVLGSSSYARVQNPGAFALLVALASQFNFCFVGTTLDEPYFIALRSAMPLNGPKHVFFVHRDEGLGDLPARGDRLRFNASHNVVIERFDDWEELGAICQRFLPRAGCDLGDGHRRRQDGVQRHAWSLPHSAPGTALEGPAHETASGWSVSA